MLKTSCIPVCSYCGKQWPKNEGTYLDVPEEVKREVDKHVQQCPKNPMVLKIGSLLKACKAAEVTLLYLLARAEATNWLPEDNHSKVNDCHIQVKQAIAAAEGGEK